jgi:hypothetical protein
MNNILELYLSHIQEIQLQEGLKEVVSKFSRKRLETVIKAMRSKDLKKISKSLSFLPSFNTAKIKMISMKSVPNFSKNMRGVKVAKGNNKEAMYLMNILYANMVSFRDEVRKKALDSKNAKLIKQADRLDNLLEELSRILISLSKAGITIIFIAKVLPIILKWLETTHRIIVLSEGLTAWMTLANVAYGYILIPTIVCIILAILIKIYLEVKAQRNTGGADKPESSDDPYGDYPG